MITTQQSAKFSVPSLKRDFSWILTGNLYYAATQYVLLIAITRLTDPETVGRFSLALAINAPVTLFLSLSLRAVMISDSKNEYSLSDYLNVRVLTSILSILVALIIVLVGGYSRDVAFPILIIAGVKAIEQIADLLYGVFQKFSKNHQIAYSMILRGTLSCVVSAAILIKTSSLIAMCFGMLGSSAVVLVLFDLWNARAFVRLSELGHANRRAMLTLSLLSLPLAFAMVLSSLEVNVPRYLIEHKIGLASLGIFSALSYPLMLGNQIVGALATAVGPRLANLFHEMNFEHFRNTLLKLVLGGTLIGAGTGLVCAFYGVPILSLLKHSEYTNDSSAFTILAFAGGVSYITVFFGAGLSAMRCFQSKLWLQVFSFSAVAIFSFIAGSKQSVYAMALAILYGSIAAFFSQALLFFFQFKKLSKIATSNQT